jgi:hypothetical protein
MAQSRDLTLRLERLETDVGELKSAVIHITDILLLQSERSSQEFRAVRAEIQGVRDEVQGVREEMKGMRQSLEERLDRLITATIRQGTLTAEHFADIERRLARLEERVGI